MVSLEKHLGVRIPLELDFRLQLAATLENMTVSELVRRAIEREVERPSPPERGSK